MHGLSDARVAAKCRARCVSMWQCGKGREASREKKAACMSEASHLLDLHHRHHRHHLQEDAQAMVE